MAERDEALLRKVGDTIAAEPRRYIQSVFRVDDANECGSAHCVAGWAVALSPDFEWANPGNPYDASARHRVTGEVHNATWAALHALGLEPDEESLFGAMWRPHGWREGGAQAVRDALYRLAEGASVDEVSA